MIRNVYIMFSSLFQLCKAFNDEISNNDHIIDVSLAGIPFSFLIDSGAEVNTITTEMYEALLKNSQNRMVKWNMESDRRRLLAYGSSEPLPVAATFYTDLYINEWRPHGEEKFYVIKGSKRALLSRGTALRYSVLQVGLSVPIQSLQSVTIDAIDSNKASKIFPKFNIPPVTLNIDPLIAPHRSTYASIPFAWRDAARKRILDMEEAGIIEKLTSDMDQRHCSAILAVPKGADDFRLVIDLRGPNRCVIREPHNMPTLDTILAELHGSSWFSTIDLSNAFFHIEIAEESRHITNFYTPDGCYRFARLPFGLCNAPDIFQGALEQILSGIKGVMIYLDDILIFARKRADHDEILKEVKKALDSHGVRLNMDKCQFGKKSVKFLGFIIGKDGYTITPDRLDSFKNFRRPNNIAEVRSFLGTIIFVDRFILSRADKTQILQQMVKNQKFEWNEEAQLEFDSLRLEVLAEIKKLGYFKQGDRTDLVVDASPIGLGAVLIQFNENNKARIIACASKALTTAEKRYPQVQREALAIVWGVERFQMFLRGQDFTIKTDNEGNEFIFGSSHKMGKRCITRAEAWALRLQPFRFKVERVSGEDNIADVFSRLIQESQVDEPFVDYEDNHVLVLDSTHDLPITATEVAILSETDEETLAVIKALSTGNWENINSGLRKVKEDLRCAGGIVFFRDKMFVPSALRSRTLRHAHKGHFGMGSMKRMLRRCVWWPKINSQVEELVTNCATCQKITHNIKPVPLSSRRLTDEPWQRLQMDFLEITRCGSGKLLMLVDTHSRMTWAIEMRKTDSDATIKALWRIFAIWGKPAVMQSDNGPPFNSPAFTEYWKNHGVRHVTVVPLSPWMNGMVERSNQGIIKTISAAILEGEDWRSSLQNYIDRYNNAIPHPSTGATPFELMTGRMFRGGLPYPYSSTTRSNITKDQVRENDERAKHKSITLANSKRGAKVSSIAEGDWVWVANKNRQSKLDSFYMPKKFRVTERNGARTTVVSEDGQKFSRWISDLKRTSVPDARYEINVGDEVCNKNKNRTDPVPPCKILKNRYKVLRSENGKLAVRSEGGDSRSCDADDATKIDKFAWNNFHQNIMPPLEIDEGPWVDGGDTEIDTQPPTLVSRPRREKKAPARLNDYELFNIFG